MADLGMHAWVQQLSHDVWATLSYQGQNVCWAFMEASNLWFDPEYQVESEGVDCSVESL